MATKTTTPLIDIDLERTETNAIVTIPQMRGVDIAAAQDELDELKAKSGTAGLPPVAHYSGPPAGALR